MMSSGVISLDELGESWSLRASRVSSTVISFLVSRESATMLVRAPSSSLMLDFMFVAMNFMTSLSML